MSDKNIEMMKKLIEEKNKKNSQKSSMGRPVKNMSKTNKTSKGISSKKTGGLLDK